MMYMQHQYTAYLANSFGLVHWFESTM